MAKHQVVDELAMVGLPRPHSLASGATAELGARRAPPDRPPAPVDLILTDFDPDTAPAGVADRAPCVVDHLRE